MFIKSAATVLLLTLALSSLNPATSQEKPFAGELAAFRTADAERPTADGGVLFVGSSSIRLWDLPKSFPELDPPPVNRGFGGSQLEHSIDNVDLLVLKHKPATVVIYAGDNDIAAGKTAERVVQDFKKLTSLVHETLPETHIGYIAIKPSLARWKLAGTMQDANQQIAKLCDEANYLTFIDIWQPMLGPNGEPREELFRDDGLHLSDKGYELWASLVQPVVDGRTTEADE